MVRDGGDKRKQEEPSSRPPPGSNTDTEGPFRLLLVDDEKTFLRTQQRVLRGIGFKVDTVTAGAEAVEWARHNECDAFLVDVAMEPTDGHSTCLQLRALDPESVVIMLTAVDTDDARLAAIEAGATDYLLKSASCALLGARIRQRIREKRSRSNPPRPLQSGRLTADPSTRAVFIDRVRVDLSEEESALFWFLVSSPGKWYRAEEIREALHLDGKSRSTQRALQRLRKLLGEVGGAIQVAKGRGYCFGPTEI